MKRLSHRKQTDDNDAIVKEVFCNEAYNSQLAELDAYTKEKTLPIARVKSMQQSKVDIHSLVKTKRVRNTTDFKPADAIPPPTNINKTDGLQLVSTLYDSDSSD